MVSIYDSTLFHVNDAFLWTLVTCCIGPFTWNMIVRAEFYTGNGIISKIFGGNKRCLLYTSPSPRD